MVLAGSHHPGSYGKVPPPDNHAEPNMRPAARLLPFWHSEQQIHRRHLPLSVPLHLASLAKLHGWLAYRSKIAAAST